MDLAEKEVHHRSIRSINDLTPDRAFSGSGLAGSWYARAQCPMPRDNGIPANTFWFLSCADFWTDGPSKGHSATRNTYNPAIFASMSPGSGVAIRHSGRLFGFHPNRPLRARGQSA